MTGTPLRKSLFTVALFAAVIAAAIGTVPAIAAPPQSATFAFEGEFDDPAGEFTSDGSIVCATGRPRTSSSRAVSRVNKASFSMI